MCVLVSVFKYYRFSYTYGFSCTASTNATTYATTNATTNANIQVRDFLRPRRGRLTRRGVHGRWQRSTRHRRRERVVSGWVSGEWLGGIDGVDVW